MIITGSIKKVREVSDKYRNRGKAIGFIPTMGALHEGHMSLVKKARKESDFVIVSIFVNPIQFAPGEDLGRYPRDLKKDEKLLRKSGVDLLFYPKASTVYPDNFSTFVQEFKLSEGLCAKSRPEHFRGVCTILAKLFNMVGPDSAYFGQKDYQQARVVKKIVDDLNYGISIKLLPTLREKDGLAMSSRNSYLKPAQRQESICLYQALMFARRLIRKGERNPEKVRAKIRNIVKSKKSTKIDYIEIVNANTLRKLNRISGKVVIAMAVYIGKIRLIDNIVINVKK